MWPPSYLKPAELEAFHTYTQLLLAGTSVASLTALRDPSAIEQRHFGESLALLDALESLDAFHSPIIDIGSGAGFPGLPIKIVRPDVRLTLLEATGKKARFLEQAVQTLGLEGVTVINARAEDLAHDLQHRGAYSLVLARAVAPLSVLVELALPFLRLGGHLGAAKGSAAPRETGEAENALEICGGRVSSVRPLDLPGPGPIPNLVLIEKVRETPSPYPRRPGTPAKRPL